VKDRFLVSVEVCPSSLRRAQLAPANASRPIVALTNCLHVLVHSPRAFARALRSAKPNEERFPRVKEMWSPKP
jgi:hypothetical protein